MSLKGGGKMYNKNEIWKDICFIENNIIYNYKGLYKVSNIGRIKSLIDNRGNSRDKILKVIKDKDGYLMVNLYKNKKGKRLKVHRLVAHMFVDGYFDGAEVDHINTISDDNRVENLRWVTTKENGNNELTKKKRKFFKHSKDTKENLSKLKTGKPVGKLIVRYQKNKKEIIDIKYQFEYTKMGFYSSGISDCCKGKRKMTSIKGEKEKFIFKYLSDVPEEDILNYIRHNMLINIEEENTNE